MPPSISVIVVSYNTRELLRECLTALAAQEHAPLETWVVDNASSDGSAALVRDQFPAVKLIENADNVGFARANNQALARASGELLLLLNPDAIVRPGCLRALAARMDDEPQLGVLGAALFNPDGSRQPSFGRFPTPTQEALFQSYLFKLVPVAYPLGRRVHARMLTDYGRYQRVDWVTGAALMLRRAVYEQVGGLPVHTFMYGEDLELCALSTSAGWTCAYEPAAEAVHHLGAAARRDHARWIGNYTHATLGYHARFSGAAQQRAVAAAVLVGSAYRSALWSGLGLLKPARRDEVSSRRAGYRHAMRLAWQSLRAAS